MIISGQLVFPDQTRSGHIRIDGDTIADVGCDLGQPDVEFGDDCLVFAGMGDIHIHARDDVSETQTYKEDFCTAAAAAVQGGVVHVADMPNNPAAPIDDESYAAKQQHLQRRNVPIQITLYAGIGPDTRPLSQSVPYKAYMGPSVGDLFFTSLEQLESALSHYRGCDVSFHCEDPVLLETHKHEATHEEQRPPACEFSATRFALAMIEKYDLTGKLCHYSVEEGLPLIRAAKQKGLRVTCEVTPHHLFFDESQITPENRGLMQMNPPLRRAGDSEAMLAGLRDGTLDYLATDHAPHHYDEKCVEFDGAPFGVVGLETAVSVCLDRLVHAGHIPLVRLVELLSVNPASILRVPGGTLGVGVPADITVLAPDLAVTVDPSAFRSLARNTPFDGWVLRGGVAATIVGGRVVYANAQADGAGALANAMAPVSTTSTAS